LDSHTIWYGGYVLLYACYYSGMAGQIFMKFRDEVVPLETNLNSSSLLHTFCNADLTDAESGEVGGWSYIVTSLHIVLLPVSCVVCSPWHLPVLISTLRQIFSVIVWYQLIVLPSVSVCVNYRCCHLSMIIRTIHSVMSVAWIVLHLLWQLQTSLICWREWNVELLSIRIYHSSMAMRELACECISTTNEDVKYMKLSEV
jgi:hypothetical protein